MKNLTLISILCFLSFGASAEISKPFVGVDYAYRSMGFKKNLGKNEFKRSLTGFNFHLGVMVSEFFGFEAGTHMGIWNKRNSSKHKLSSFHTSLTGEYPFDDILSLVGSLGLSKIKISYKDSFYNFSYPKFKVKRNTVPRVSAGLKVYLTESIWGRFMATMEGTKAVNHSEVKPQHSVVIHSGVGFTF